MAFKSQPQSLKYRDNDLETSQINFVLDYDTRGLQNDTVNTAINQTYDISNPELSNSMIMINSNDI